MLKRKNAKNNKIVFDEIEENEFNGKSHVLFKHSVLGKILDGVKVSYYPTLIKIENGDVVYFEGERNPHNLAKWVGHNMVGGNKMWPAKRGSSHSDSYYGGKKSMRKGTWKKKYGKTKCSKKHRRTCKKWTITMKENN